MKTAIYIEDGVLQLVLSPSNTFERDMLRSFKGKDLACQVFEGEFYDSKGGWVRQHDPGLGWQGMRRVEEEHRTSLIVRLAPPPPPQPDYAAAEREHLGDPEKKTGIYAEVQP